MPRDVICQRPRDRNLEDRTHGLEYRVCIGLTSLLRETSFWGNVFLCRLRMYHYGWLCEELTLISEMYADAMDVNHCNSAKNSSPEIPFLRRWRQRSPRTLS